MRSGLCKILIIRLDNKSLKKLKKEEETNFNSIMTEKITYSYTDILAKFIYATHFAEESETRVDVWRRCRE